MDHGWTHQNEKLNQAKIEEKQAQNMLLLVTKKLCQVITAKNGQLEVVDATHDSVVPYSKTTNNGQKIRLATCFDCIVNNS